jgi:hypothetical protein
MQSMPDGTIHAEGGIIVQGQGVTVRSENMRFDPGTDTILLTGGVVMEEASGGSFTGDSLALDLADLTGGISRGEIIVVPNGFRVRGEDIKRLGPEEFSVRKGVFTSCPGECPDWSFTATRINVRKEGYLSAKHAAFRIAGFPVFYTPYLYYPVKTKRQTGFLLPEIRISDETGLESSWPFFMTLGPHADATLTPRTFSRDGFGLGAEARYRLNLGGSGDWNGFAMNGGNDDRWYYGGDHAMPLTGNLWFRARWYDAGNSLAPALFGRSFEERYPGAVYRHASIEGESGVFGVSVTADSLLTEATLSRAGIPADRINSNKIGVDLGPLKLGLLRAGISGGWTRFDEGTERNLVNPAVTMEIPGPGYLSGSISGQAIISTGGDGTVEDEAYILTLRERAAAHSRGKWGTHRVDMDLMVSSVQGAAFGLTVVRDRSDFVEERLLSAARVRSRYTLREISWDLEIGGWRDDELDLKKGYGYSRVSSGRFFVEASVNRDSQWGLVLPSVDVRSVAVKGLQTEMGYESEALEVAAGRESSDGSPDLVNGRLRVLAGGIEISGQAFYDLDTRSMADETLSVVIPGRCWTLTISRSRNPDRTDWKVNFGLGI